MSQSKQVTEGALLTGVYIVILLLTLFIPFFILIGLLLLPIPFIIYSSRYGVKSAAVMFLATLFIAIIFATIVSVPLTILAGLGGIIIGVSMLQHATPFETLARGTVGFIGGFTLVFVLLYFVLNVNIYYEVEAIIEESIAMTETFVQQFNLDMGGNDPVETIETQMNAFKDLLPSSIALISLLIAFISQWLSYKVLNRVKRTSYYFPPFQQFNLPVAVLWIYFFSLIISFFQLNTDSGLTTVVMNILAFSTILIAIQGFSFIFFYAHLKNIHMAFPIIVIVITLLLPFLLLFLIRIIGIIDLGFSLKKRLAQGKT